MTRTKLADRTLPRYTAGEEIFNMVSHIVGGGFGVIALTLCVVFASVRRNFWGLGGGIVYGLMMIFVYTMSSVYHGLPKGKAKKVLQVLDHCSIYAMIFGTYMPILLTGIRSYSVALFFGLLTVLVTGTAVGVTFTAIDFHRYAVIATGGYFVVGWSIIFALRSLLSAFGLPFFLWMLAGGVVYCLGMIFFALGIKRPYCHGVFHLFILAGSALQFVGIFRYCILL